MFVDYAPEKEVANKAQAAKTDIWGRTFSYAALFRGGMTSSQVDDALVFLRGDMDVTFPFFLIYPFFSFLLVRFWG